MSERISFSRRSLLQLLRRLLSSRPTPLGRALIRSSRLWPNTNASMTFMAIVATSQIRSLQKMKGAS